MSDELATLLIAAEHVTEFTSALVSADPPVSELRTGPRGVLSFRSLAGIDALMGVMAAMRARHVLADVAWEAAHPPLPQRAARAVELAEARLVTTWPVSDAGFPYDSVPAHPGDGQNSGPDRAGGPLSGTTFAPVTTAPCPGDADALKGDSTGPGDNCPNCGSTDTVLNVDRHEIRCADCRQLIESSSGPPHVHASPEHELRHQNPSAAAEGCPGGLAGAGGGAAAREVPAPPPLDARPGEAEMQRLAAQATKHVAAAQDIVRQLGADSDSAPPAEPWEPAEGDQISRWVKEPRPAGDLNSPDEATS